MRSARLGRASHSDRASLWRDSGLSDGCAIPGPLRESPMWDRWTVGRSVDASRQTCACEGPERTRDQEDFPHPACQIEASAVKIAEPRKVRPGDGLLRVSPGCQRRRNVFRDMDL